ncbi:MAG: adenosylmethionine decarboxylase [Chloroflexi bacterium]|nr:adenosylmethionine decarboxylase [Chloroflexota bacterium]
MPAPPAHRHILADFVVKDVSLLRSVEPLWSLVYESAAASGVVVLDHCVHQFVPYGFTGLLLLSQSHVSIHTWVEERLVLLDVQTCGDMKPELIVEDVRRALEPCQVLVRTVTRG